MHLSIKAKNIIDGVSDNILHDKVICIKDGIIKDIILLYGFMIDKFILYFYAYIY